MKIGDYYKHTKTGNLYIIRYIGSYSEDRNQTLVGYEALYTNKDGQHWVRFQDMFLGLVEIQGKQYPRFAKIPFLHGLIHHLWFNLKRVL